MWEAPQTCCPDTSALSLPSTHSVPWERLLTPAVLCFWCLAFSWASEPFIFSLLHSAIFVVLLLCARGCARHWGRVENRIPALVIGHDTLLQVCLSPTPGRERSREAHKKSHLTPPTDMPTSPWWADSSPLHLQPDALYSDPPPSTAALDSLPTPPPLSWVCTKPKAWSHLGTLPSPPHSARQQALSVVRTHLQPLPVHAATTTPGSLQQPRVQLPSASYAWVPRCSSGCSLTTQVLSLHPWFPRVHKVEKDLDADLASRGLHSQVSANSFTLNSHQLLLRTHKFQGFPNFSIYKVCRKHLPGPGTVLIFFLHPQSY